MISDHAQVALSDLRRHMGSDSWLKDVCTIAEHEFSNLRHGDLTRWLRALDDLPAVQAHAELNRPAPSLGAIGAEPEKLHESLMQLHPWRKGPLRLGGVEIDTEWRSDWKWRRISPHIDLNGAAVLDIGCGNGYYGWRMLGEGARLVVGIDPTLVFVMQWLASRHFAGELANFVLPLRAEQLPAGRGCFDWVFSMGVLYHRQDHLAHLRRLLELLKPGGTLVLESLVLPNGATEPVLIPHGRYARMRNVWAVPETAVIIDWLGRAGFTDVRLVDVSTTSCREQRTTEWMHFESLREALDPENPAQTVEGHPAPRRAVFLARSSAEPGSLR